MEMTPNESMVPGLAIAPQAIGTTDVDGVAIVRPWEIGRYITFMAIGGALVGADALTVKVQARRAGTSTWDDVQDSTGAADLAFTVSKLSDGGAVENGVVIGSLDLERLTNGNTGNTAVNLPKVSGTAYDYDAIRLTAVNANNSSPGIVGFGYLITHIRDTPAKDAAGALVTDDLLLDQLPHTLA
jgi:hypothetical protein